MKILILDDDPFVLKLLGIQLKAFGLRHRGFLELVSCEQGAQALAQLEAGHDEIGLIFCDLQMPEMDGVEFVRHLVRLKYRGSLVLISGEDQRILQTAEQMARAHGLKVLGALHKPVFPEMLHRMLDLALLSAAPEAAPADSAAYAPAELREALAAGQLLNHYQPKLRLDTGEPVGLEAQVRWQHPRDGLLMPQAFIATAEASGLLAPICQAMLATALVDAAQWRDEGHDLHVAASVSLSASDGLDFPDVLARYAAAAGVPLGAVVLQVSQSRLLDDPAAQLDVLARLRLKRVGLSIDEFGEGHADANLLRDLPFGEAKIDPGFVNGVASDLARQAVLDRSLGMARQLGLAAVADGVEDPADLVYLRRSGCQLVQGNLVAAPMPIEKVVPWLGGWPTTRRALFD